MTLYEINRQIEDILNQMFETADEETGEVSEDALKQLEELKTAREEKLDNIGAFIKNLEAESEAIRKEMDALKKRLTAKTKKIERLKNYVAMDLLSHEEKKFESARVAYSFRKSVRVEITDESKLPKKYFIKTFEYKPNKTEIGKILAEGHKIRGAELVEKQNLQIK